MSDIKQNVNILQQLGASDQNSHWSDFHKYMCGNLQVEHQLGNILPLAEDKS